MELICYIASAGTGKTTCLTNHLIQTLPTDEKEIYTWLKRTYAITFTNKATYEIKKRFLEKVKKQRSELYPILLYNYDRLQIRTWDSLLRYFAQPLLFANKFQITQNLFLESALLEEQIAEKLLYQYYNGAPHSAIVSFIKIYFQQQLKDGKRLQPVKHIRKRIKESLEKLPIILETTSIEILENFQKTLDELRNEYYERLKKTFLPLLNTLLLHQDVFRSEWKRRLQKGSKNKALLIKELLSLKFFRALFRDCLLNKKKRLSSKQKKEIEEVLKKLKEHFWLYLDYKVVEDLSQLFYNTILTQEIWQLLQWYYEELGWLYWRFLLLTLQRWLEKDALRAWLYEVYEQKGLPQFFFVDEFQDTSAIQYGCIKPFWDEMAAQNDGVPRKVFVVGDPKQTIYQWRDSRPELLLKLTQDFPHIPEGNIKETFLKTNYRSSKAIIESVKEVFEKLIACLETAQEPLLGHLLNGEIDNTFSLGACLNLFKKGIEVHVHKEEEGYALLEPLSNKEEAKEWLITYVGRLVKEKGVAYGDIMVLCRRNEEVRFFSQALAEANIPVMAQRFLTWEHVSLLQWFISMVKWKHYKRDDYLWEATAAFLRFLNPKKQYTQEDFKETFESLKQRCSNIYHEAPLPLAVRLLTALRKDYPLTQPSWQFSALFECLSEFPYQHCGTLEDFLSYWERVKNRVVSIQTNAEETHKDQVEVLTIHQAKGLQSKAVIIPWIDWSLFPQRNNEKVHLNKFPFLPNAFDSVFPLECRYPGAHDTPYFYEYGGEHLAPLLQQWQSVEHRSAVDALNLLYVSLTRAESVLLAAYNSSTRQKFSIANFLKEIFKEGGRKEWGNWDAISSSKEGSKGKVLSFSWHLPDALEDWQWHHQPLIPAEKRFDWAQEAIEEGSALHKWLSRIITKEDLKNLPQAPVEELKKILNHQPVSAFYNKKLLEEGWQVRNELALFIKGHHIVVDRLLWHPEKKHLVIIEYKTTSTALKDHPRQLLWKEQLRNYVRLCHRWFNALWSRGFLVTLSEAVLIVEQLED